MPERLLILNPGSTSTKAAVYEDDRQLAMKNIVHTNQDLAPYPTLYDQLDYRVALVRGWLGQEGIGLSTLSAVVGRGGIIPNIVAGGYQVDDALVDCLLHHTVFDHASNLGGLMARAFAAPLGIPAYIYDAVTSDELLPEARVTGFKEVTRTSFCHVLNARATAHKYAEALGRKYEDMNLVVAHLGGGISISAHSRGRIIDSVADDAGPFSPDRSGSLNMLYVVEMCYSGKYTKADMLKKLRGEGGMSALLGTHDCQEIERSCFLLAKLLRYSLQDYRDSATIEEEFESLQSYLNLMKLRFEHKIQYAVDLDPELRGLRLPRLTLQPLVENAIIHGVADLEEGYIKLWAEEDGGDLLLRVSDNGRGIAPEVLDRLARHEDIPGGHLGLNNVDRIIRLYYGEGYGLTAESGDTGSRVTLRLPMMKGDSHAKGTDR